MAEKKSFMAKAFQDMKESAKEQHQVDKANFDAVKAESKANFAEAKAASNPEVYKAMVREKQAEEIVEANKRKAEADARKAVAQGKK